MQKKNSGVSLITIVGLIVVVFGGIYLYKQKFQEESLGNDTKEELLNRTQIFVSRRNILDRVNLDMSFLDDKRFYSLLNFSTPVAKQPIGKKDLFSEPNYEYQKLSEETGGQQ